jgi:hypothetical protein
MQGNFLGTGFLGLSCIGIDVPVLVLFLLQEVFVWGGNRLYTHTFHCGVVSHDEKKQMMCKLCPGAHVTMIVFRYRLD